MRLIARQAMLNQLVIRDDSVTKLEGVIMASMTGESCPRPSVNNTTVAQASFKFCIIISYFAKNAADRGRATPAAESDGVVDKRT